MEDNEKCICGSGECYESCCKPYIVKTIKDYDREIKNNNYIKAYYIAVGMLSNYLLKVQADTEFAVTQNPIWGKVLVSLDVKALSELTERIYNLLFEKHIGDNWGERFDSIKLLLNDSAWQERCLYYQLIYYSMENKSGKYSEQISKILITKPYVGMDSDLLMCMYENYPIDGNLTKTLQMLDIIIETVNTTLLKLIYKYSKAIRLSLANDIDSAKEIADEVIHELDKSDIDIFEPYQNNQIACIYEMYYNFDCDLKWLQKSLEIRKKVNMDIFTNLGKSMQFSQIGYTYWRMGEYFDAKQWFEKSIQYEALDFAQIYLLDCLVELKEVVDLRKYLEEINIKKLGVDTFDFLYIIGNAAIKLDDTKSIKIIKKYLQQVTVTGNPYFDLCIKDLQIEVEKKSGTFRALLGRLKSFENYFLFQPNFAGIGFNGNKLLEDLTSEVDE